jgi:protein HOOK3
MSLSQESQIEMKNIIESSLQLLEDYDNQANFDDDDDLLGNDLVFDDDVGGVNGSGGNGGTDASADDISKQLQQTSLTDADKEGLDQALLEARRELAMQKSQLIEVREDAEKAQSKLRSIVEDLQDRLAKRQDELIESEEELRDATTELDALKTRVGELEEEKAQLADELDVASAKAQQLHKAEATVLAYKKKLDGVGVMNQQMTDLEDQAAGYLRQIMDLESEVKKTTALTKQVDSLQDQLSALEQLKSENADFIKNSTAEIAELKAQLASSNKARKAYEDELKEYREQQAVTHEDVVVEGFDSQAPVSAEQREKMMRLEIENKKLKDDLEALKAGGAVASSTETPAAAVSPATPAEDTEALKLEIENLKAELQKKTAENKKIGSDKEKLEAYTKRTLAKFQDKYLVALQECKAKLKEKQDKIEILESRSATEKTAQKREERLLSSTIYELGLAIMQNRLKER